MPNVPPKQNLSDTAIATIVSGFASRSDVTIDDILTLVERLRATPADAPATALANIPAAAAPIVDAVRAGAVPGHANEEGAIMTIVSRPPVLRLSLIHI